MIIQELKPSKRVEGRWLAVMEDGSILRIGEGEVVSFALYAGRELLEEEAVRLLDAARRSGLKSKAIELLMRKPQSRKELERRLLEWEASQEEAEAICDRMEELGYLNEPEYAGRIVRHYAGKGFGQRKLRDELYRRGIPRELWEEALSQVEDHAPAIDAFLEKKLKGSRDPKEIKRASDALARRGFSWSEISDGLRRYGMEVWD
ncbi:regulatory protein RecX [Pseudoflavonifractor sp. 60]|uniref:regulatory protein RecX n=1 Tax=Pseudoflavonifractor sp. 60 TaxID=2304576 RepID=UPI00136E569E|nr:regulatory protein RecX [Pseudoflavonifractor sp. 60]NBI68884.1 regulatory protein RecX [Pseudoflavonifractor sp. 60]